MTIMLLQDLNPYQKYFGELFDYRFSNRTDNGDYEELAYGSQSNSRAF